ncbi:GNAT family N-acetyltransferase [Streptomyces sp. L7]
MDDFMIRPGRTPVAELGAVAELRWRWILEGGEQPVATREEFVRGASSTGRAEHAGSHRCMVAVRDGAVIGMAWLAVVQRVPSPRALHRASGDLQCVYVIPGERDSGVGGRLVEAVLGRARELGLERVTRPLLAPGDPRLRPTRLRLLAPAAAHARLPRGLYP